MRASSHGLSKLAQIAGQQTEGIRDSRQDFTDLIQLTLEEVTMIPYKLPDEKEVLLQYSEQFRDFESRKIIERGVVNNHHEARTLAEFFWKAFTESASRIENRSAMQATHEYVFLTLVDTLFAYFHLAGYPDVWDDATQFTA
jgi:hypothetical protein